MTIHANGSGIVSDQAEARPTAYIDSASFVKDRARVHSGRIINSTVGIECRVYGATIRNSTVVCDEVVGATVIDSELYDQCAIWDQAVLCRVVGRQGARVYGQARIIGLKAPVWIWGDMRICYGTFHRSPRYDHLGFCFLTESAPGWAAVDCKFAPYDRWFRIGYRYARRQYGWTREQHDKVRDVFRIWQAEEDLKGKHWGRCVEGCQRL